MQDIRESGKRRIQRLMKYYVHQVPGRLRIKIPSLRSSAEQAQKIQGVLEELNGVESAAANPVTGSVLVLYDRETVDSEEILEALEDRGYLDKSSILSSQDQDSGSFSRHQEVIGKALFGWAVGKALENTGLSFLTALI
jgi:copper chaperone CopZ